MSVCGCVCERTASAHRGVDLAVVGGHAVPVVEVGEGLGGAPGLQVARHPDRSPHLPPVQGGTGADTQEWAVPLGLGRRGRWITLTSCADFELG